MTLVQVLVFTERGVALTRSVVLTPTPLPLWEGENMQLAKSDGRQIWAFVFGEGIFYHTVFTCATAIVCLNSAFTPFNHQSSKSCFNYEPCLFLPLNSIRTNKRAFSAIMGLSIGWQPETLCMFVSGYVRVRKLSHVWMCYCVSVGVEQFETDKLKDIWGVCVCMCVSAVWSLVHVYGCCQWRAEGMKH